MDKWVLGFVFSENNRDVLLIRKRRPKTQAGRLNGIGGKIEPTDASRPAAMEREFREETGVTIDVAGWLHFATLVQPAGNVICYTCEDNRAFCTHKTTTDEQVGIYSVSSIMLQSQWLAPMANLRMLIALAQHVYDMGAAARIIYN